MGMPPCSAGGMYVYPNATTLILFSLMVESVMHMLDSNLADVIKDRFNIILLPSTFIVPPSNTCYHGESVDHHHVWNLIIASFYVGHDKKIEHELR